MEKTNPVDSNEWPEGASYCLFSGDETIERGTIVDGKFVPSFTTSWEPVVEQEVILNVRCNSTAKIEPFPANDS